MTDFLVRRFISNHQDTSDPAVRRAYGQLGGGVGIFLNLLLFLGKLLAGLLTGSIAVTADAFNNLSDAGSSVVTLIGFRLAGQKPDRDHPYGHGRAEYLSGLLVSLVILLMGVELLKSSVGRILAPQALRVDLLSAAVLIVSVLVKLFMSRFYKQLGGRIGSAALAAASSDSLSDAMSTSAVLIGTLAGAYLDLPLDGWLGAAVAVLILITGWKAAKETSTPLLGAPPDPDFVRQVTDCVLEHPEIRGVHDLIVHDYGPGRRMVSLHAEVDRDGDLMTLHEVIDHIEKELTDRFGCAAVIHMDPMDNDDETAMLTQKVSLLARVIDPGSSVHDLRLRREAGRDVLEFDMVLPLDSRLSPEEAKAAMEQAVSVFDKQYTAEITVDRPYI